MISLKPRSDVSSKQIFFMPVLSILLSIVLGGMIFAALGYDAFEALYQFFIAPLSRPDQIGNLFVKACPLIIIGTGLVFCYRANIWNIGAEGQLIFGALGAGWVALYMPETSAFLMLVLMMLTSMMAGALLAAVPAFLKTRFQTNEILVSLMLTYVAALVIDWLVRGPWRDPMSFGFPLTPYYPDAALIGKLSLPVIGRLGQLHWGILIALFVAGAGWFVLKRTLAGFKVRVAGDAPRAARFAGFNASVITYAVLLGSGALAGLAGMVEVSANIGHLQPQISFGYGFTAIIVAFLARLNPASVIIAALIVALTELGGDSAQIALGIPKVVTGVFKGILLFLLLAGETITRYKVTVSLPSGTLSGKGGADV